MPIGVGILYLSCEGRPIVNELPTRLLAAMVLVLASGVGSRPAAQEVAAKEACAELLTAIESLNATLAQGAKARTAEDDTQRMQVVMTLLTLRYRNIDTLKSALRGVEGVEDDLRSEIASQEVRIEALAEAAKKPEMSAPDVAAHESERSHRLAELKGLEERAKRFQQRRADYQGQLAVEQRDIDKLEAIVRAWLETAR
jgi:hypothetical protein